MDLNHRPLDYQSSALPIELREHMVGRAGVEPAEALANRFTVCTAASYGIPAHKLPMYLLCKTIGLRGT